MVGAIGRAKVGDRVMLNWMQDERNRVVGLRVMQAQAPAASRPADGEGGTIKGVVTAKSENRVEVRADGGDKPESYSARRPASEGGQPDKDIVAQIAKVKVGDRVEVKWTFQERKRVLSITALEGPK